MHNTIEFYQVSQNPPPVSVHSTTSKWKGTFESMRCGEWFALPSNHRARVASAAGKYLRGRYRLYKHPTITGMHVFVKAK